MFWEAPLRQVWLSLIFIAAIQPHFGIAQNDNTALVKFAEDPDCPCLSADVHVNTPKLEMGCLDARMTPNSSSTIQSSYCYPKSYGVGCAAHDLNLEPYCVGDSNNFPSFCDQSWCYVDREKCQWSTQSTFAQSAYFPNLYYSYTTCGAVDAFRDFNTASVLRGRKLRVGIPALYYPDHYRLDESGNPIMFNVDYFAGEGELRGIFIDLIKSLAVDGGFEVEFSPVSSGAYVEQDWDSWGGCVFDVSRGILDMCVGNFWETTQRRSMVQFSTSILNDVYYLMVPLPKIDDGIRTKVKLLFEPFTNDLWGVIIGATFLVGILYTVLGPNGARITNNICQNCTLSNIASNIYFAWSELLQGSDASGEKTVAQRSLALSWAFFVLIIIAAYTANLAAFLGKETVVYDIKSIEECLSKSCLLCHFSGFVLSSQLSSLYPALRRSSYTDIESMIDDLIEGKCDAIVLSEYEWTLNSNWWKDCATTFIGNFVVFFKVGWPMSPPIAQALSYWIGKSLDNLAFEKILEKYRPPPQCPSILETSRAEMKLSQIDVLSMAGPLIILGGGIMLGLFLKYGPMSIQAIELTMSDRQVNGIDSPLEGHENLKDEKGNEEKEKTKFLLNTA